jgi:hypothetical protein
MLDRADIEGDALAMYRLAKLEPDQPVALGRLVRALLGTEVQQAAFVRGKAHLSWFQDRWWIYVHRGIPLARLRFDVGHELGHWWYRRCGYSGEDIELRCDALGAALVAPMPLFRSVRKRISTVVQVARAIGSTQSLALLRDGEVLGTPVALVQDRRVLVRGHEWGWPTEPELRRLASSRSPGPGLRKVTIRDEPNRVGVMVAA